VGAAMKSINDYVTYLFILVELIVLVLLFTNKRYEIFRKEYGPEIFTTIGILGTFVGTSLALYRLGSNTDNIISSLPSFIAALKFAFVASAVGILLAIITRWISSANEKKNIAETETYLNDEEVSKNILLELKQLNKGLVGNEEGTLLTQLKLLRQEGNDNFTQLKKSFEDFSEKLLEQNQQAFIDALRAAISDFNTTLTEQVGENFKHLNASVEKLVVWQDEYKDTLEKLSDHQKQTSESMTTASNSFKDLIANSSSFVETASVLRVTIIDLHKLAETLFVQSNSLAQVLRTMSDVVPTFSIKIDSMISEIESGIKKVMESIDESIRLSIETNNKEISAYVDQIKSISEEFRSVLTETIRENQRTVNSGVEEGVTKMRETVTMLDRALQKELTDSLQSLSTQLISLSNKFVADYTPLTERLKEIVSISNRI
jgi:hypothetical protein